MACTCSTECLCTIVGVPPVLVTGDGSVGDPYTVSDGGQPLQLDQLAGTPGNVGPRGAVLAGPVAIPGAQAAVFTVPVTVAAIVPIQLRYYWTAYADGQAAAHRYYFVQGFVDGVASGGVHVARPAGAFGTELKPLMYHGARLFTPGVNPFNVEIQMEAQTPPSNVFNQTLTVEVWNQ